MVRGGVTRRRRAVTGHNDGARPEHRELLRRSPARSVGCRSGQPRRRTQSRQSPGPLPGRSEARPRTRAVRSKPNSRKRAAVRRGSPASRGRRAARNPVATTAGKSGRDSACRKIAAPMLVGSDTRVPGGADAEFLLFPREQTPILRTSAGALHALIGEKSQGDNPREPGFNHVPGDGAICPLTLVGYRWRPMATGGSVAHARDLS